MHPGRLGAVMARLTSVSAGSRPVTLSERQSEILRAESRSGDGRS